jgi:hypothetical protein
VESGSRKISKFLLSSIQPMPQYETSFHLKIMANGKNLGEKLKAIGKDFISLNVIISPKTWEAPGSLATNCFPML